MKKTRLRTRFSLRTSGFNAMISLKGGRAFVNHLTYLIRLCGLRLSDNYLIILVSFLRKCNKIVKKNGISFLINLLKAQYVVLQQSLAGYVVQDLRLLKSRFSRTHSGLPRWIPASHRKAIRNGNYNLVRLWLSLFSLYRIFDSKYIFSLSTISEPSKFDSSWNPAYKVFLKEIFLINLKRLTGDSWLRITMKDPIKGALMLTFKPFFSAKSSPTAKGFASGSMWSVLTAAQAWNNFAGPLPALMNFITKTGNSSTLGRWMTFYKLRFPEVSRSEPLSKLGFKEEAAGKLRVFAMVDVITQWVLKPLHDRIFTILRGIPQDGTFDQIKPVKTLIKNFPQGPYYSFDLSAATDRLPIEASKQLLASLIGDELAENWKSLLVDRGYHWSRLDNKSGKLSMGITYYAVGQPMGALSSWSLGLALFHHSLVQYASYRVLKSNTWFTAYALLGDDIVIANELVASEYQLIMKELDVTIGLAKSILSPKGLGLEFAKRYFLHGIDCSPIAIKEILTFENLMPSIELVRKYSISLSDFLFMRGFGFKAVASTNKKLGLIKGVLQADVLMYKLMINQIRVDSLSTTKLLDSFEKFLNSSISSRIRALGSRVGPLFQSLWMDRSRAYYGTIEFSEQRMLTYLGRSVKLNAEQKRFVYGTWEMFFREHYLDTVGIFNKLDFEFTTISKANLSDLFIQLMYVENELSKTQFPFQKREEKVDKQQVAFPNYLKAMINKVSKHYRDNEIGN